MGVIPNLLVSGVGLGAILGLLAFGFALSYWPSRQFHFAYAGVVVAASYTYWSLTSHGISWIIGLVVTLIVSAVLGVACYALVYRRLTDSGAVFLSGFALSLIVSNAIEWGFGSVPSLVQPPFASLGNVVELGGLRIPILVIVELVIFLLVVSAISIAIYRSRLGVAVRGVSSDLDLAQAAGINSNRLLIVMYAVGSMVAAIGAILLAYQSGISPNDGFNPMLFAINGMLVGGRRSFIGGAAGGFGLGVILQLSLWKLPSAWQTTTAFVVLVIIVLVRPQGVFGRKVEA
jgi:branched-chain amino acid transport system permease protein